MTKTRTTQWTRAVLLATTLLSAPHIAHAVDTTVDDNNGTLPLPTGQYVTPTAPTSAIQQFLNPGLPAYPNFVANEAVRSQLSPDGKTLLIICAGYNNNLDSSGNNDLSASNQYIFVYDVSGANKTKPVLSQVVQQSNSYVGLVWAPDGSGFYATGGVDDAVYFYTKTGGSFVQAAKIGLGHNGVGVGNGVEPNAGGLGISADGSVLVVANNYNDSISVIDTATKTVRFEHDLRPYLATNENTDGAPGGQYPFTVVLKGNTTAYVSANRDREVVVIDIGTPGGKLSKRIAMDGNPNGMTINKAQTTLYVAQDNADQVAVVDIASNAITAKIDARAPAGVLSGPKYTGAATYAVTLSPDEKTLYAVNDGANSVAVIALAGSSANTTIGLIPTAYAPKDITISADGTWMYIINGKSDQGPNPKNLYGSTDRITSATYPGGNVAANTAAAASNQYQLNNNRSTLVSAQVPSSADLPSLTARVAQNNFYSVPQDPNDTAVMSFLRGKIQHVIYIIKENRTFDQVLGDLTNGANGDPTLTLFGRRLTPSLHRIATRFTTMDNFFDTGDASMDGWSWSLQGRATSTLSLTQQINYAGVDRGLSYDSEGANRNVPTGLTAPQRISIFGSAYTGPLASVPGGPNNVLPGVRDVAATDSPFGIERGYIFDAVLAAGGTLRNYGFLTVNVGSIGTGAAPIKDPFMAGVPQVVPLQKTMVQAGITDLYFRGYDNAYPDLWRFNEWNREFQQYVANGKLPTMETVRLMHDHTGSFGSALGGVNTPETQVADNDYAVGRLVETVANSPYAANTLIFVIEDDSQDGPDHIDSHRTTAYVVGPYVKQNAVVSTRYTTVNFLRTIEDVLGLQHLNLNTAYQRPMSDIFDTSSSGAWTYNAVASTVLKTTSILAMTNNTIQYAEGPDVVPTHDAKYWAQKTRGFDFSNADRVPADLFNEVLWNGIMQGQAYPTARSGLRMGTTDVTND
ncbi:MAG: alkaline phosphatase family protein [Acetobacteraceae bacterium]